MKNIRLLLSIILLIGFSTIASNAQLNCKDSISISLNAYDGNAEITLDSVVIGEIPHDATLSKTKFDCSDVGSSVIVQVQSNQFLCEVTVKVKDITPPVVIVKSDVTVSYLQRPEILPEDLNDGTFDLCNIISLRTEPSSYSIEMVGSIIPVKLIATDLSGNESFAISNVYLQGEIPSIPAYCRSPFTLKIQDDYFVKPYIIQNTNHQFINWSLELVTEEGTIIQENKVGPGLFGKSIGAKLSQIYDDSYCTTTIFIEQSECNPIDICDIDCQNSNGTSCEEGHSTQDDIEWPCQLLITENISSLQELQPDHLELVFNIDRANTRPFLNTEACQVTSISFEDKIYPLETGLVINRVWIVFDSQTSKSYEFSQEINVPNASLDVLWNICDTAANSAPEGDCSSGHTLSDDIEWPNDVQASDHRIHPNELRTISGIDQADAHPQVKNPSNYELSYTDNVYASSEQVMSIHRKWSISSVFNKSLSSNYTQVITFPILEERNDLVYVTTFGGRPMPEVDVNSILTNELGFANIDSQSALELKYEDRFEEGLDILDLYLFKQYLLGELNLPHSLNLGLDLSGDGIISVSDLLLLQKIILGDEVEATTGWYFTERLDPLVENRADFIAYKMGDLDDSALLKTQNDKGESFDIVVEDQLLNKGETYTVDFKLGNQKKILGAKIQLSINDELVEMIELKTDIRFTDSNLEWYRYSDSLLNVLLYDIDPLLLSDRGGMFTMHFEAKENTTLYEVLGIVSTNGSYYVEENLEKTILNIKVGNQITSKTEDLNTSFNLEIYPNPANDFLFINDEKHEISNISVWNLQGEKVLQPISKPLNVSTLKTGMYILSYSHKNQLYSTKFIKQ